MLTFISGSIGGRNAIAKLLGNVARSAQAAEGKMPVAQLETGTYDHADYGTVAYPIFKIIDWAYWDGEPKRSLTRDLTEELDDAIPF